MKSDYGNEFIPRRATEGSAGYDFYSPIEVNMSPNVWYRIDTGIHLELGDIGEHEVMQIYPRSSLGFEIGLRFANTVGIIDSDFRDSIKATIAVNTPYTLRKGERFMQGIITQYHTITHEIPPTAKRTGGLGSTGRM